MEEKIKRLKEKLQNIGTRDLLGMIGVHFLTFANNGSDVAEQSDIFNKTNLTSPQKQYTYLAGLLMSTDDKSNGKITPEDDSKIYSDLENDVQEITMEYIRNFLDVGEMREEDTVKRNLVSMEAFTSYFDMGILRYPEQTIKLIRELYSGFDSELENLTSLTTEDFIAFYQLICDVFEEGMNAPKTAMNNIKSFLDSLNPYAVDIKREFERIIAFDGTNFQKTIDNMSCIKATRVLETFGENKGKTLLAMFGLHRNETDFLYYNCKNPFATHPLCWIDEETLFIIHPNFVLNAEYNLITDILENPTNKFAVKYKKVKAEIVEGLFL